LTDPRAPRRARLLWLEELAFPARTPLPVDALHYEVLVGGRFTVGAGKEADVRVGDPFRNTRPGYERPELLVAPIHAELSVEAEELVVHRNGNDTAPSVIPLPRGGEARVRIGLHDFAVQAAEHDEERDASPLGKARALHESTRPGRPLVFVDCRAAAGIDVLEAFLFGYQRSVSFGGRGGQTYRGALEVVAGGTLFLSEVAALPKDLQPKLLRLLEQKKLRRVGDNRFQPFDGRLVATTEHNLATLITEGKFWAELVPLLDLVSSTAP
jgi:hypothetical protein